MSKYSNLKKNEEKNQNWYYLILGVYLGSIITVILGLFNNIIPAFQEGLMPFKEIAIFIILLILSIQSLLFYKDIIIKIKDTPKGNSLSISLSVVLLSLLALSLILPQFTLIGIGMGFICLKAGQLFYMVKNKNIGNETENYFKKIYGSYVLISIFTLFFALGIDFEIIPFLPIVYDLPEYNQAIIQLSSLSNSENTINLIKNVLGNLHSELQTTKNKINIILAIGIFISFLIVIYNAYKFVLIRKINKTTVLEELNNHYNNGKNDQKTNSKQIVKSITAILTIIRPFVSCIAGLIASVVYFNTSNIFQFPVAVMLFLIVFMTSSYGFVLNDYFDKEKDKIDHKKRPIPSGSFSTKNAILLSIILASISLFFSIFIGFEGLIINISTIFLLGIYSKINNKYGILANIITATICSFILIIGMSAGSFSWIILYLSLATFFLILGREIILDIRDLNSDEAIGKVSYPIKYGIKRSVNFAILLLSITTLFLLFTSVITNSIGFFIILGIIANLMLWIGIINYRKSFDKEKLERFLIISRITFILMIPALFFI